MEMIKITIDGRELTAPAGQTVLQIALDNGIEIPHLCDNPELKIYGACGMCVVQAEGIGKLLRSCATVATDGMVVHTHSQRVDQEQNLMLSRQLFLAVLHLPVVKVIFWDVSLVYW